MMVRNIEEIKRVEEEIKVLEARMNEYEQKAPGRDRITSLQVKITSLSRYLDELKAS